MNHLWEFFILTNLTSLYKYHNDLEQILSQMKIDFQIIGITEHKIKDLTTIIFNVKLAGYCTMNLYILQHKHLMVVQASIYETA